MKLPVLLKFNNEYGSIKPKVTTVFLQLPLFAFYYHARSIGVTRYISA